MKKSSFDWQKKYTTLLQEQAKVYNTLKEQLEKNPKEKQHMNRTLREVREEHSKELHQALAEDAKAGNYVKDMKIQYNNLFALVGNEHPRLLLPLIKYVQKEEIGKGLATSFQNYDTGIALHLALTNRENGAAGELLAAGVNPLVKTGISGHTALHKAVLLPDDEHSASAVNITLQNTSPSILRTLLTEKDNSGRTALDYVQDKPLTKYFIEQKMGELGLGAQQQAPTIQARPAKAETSQQPPALPPRPAKVAALSPAIERVNFLGNFLKEDAKSLDTNSMGAKHPLVQQKILNLPKGIQDFAIINTNDERMFTYNFFTNANGGITLTFTPENFMLSNNKIKYRDNILNKPEHALYRNGISLEFSAQETEQLYQAAKARQQAKQQEQETQKQAGQQRQEQAARLREQEEKKAQAERAYYQAEVQKLEIKDRNGDTGLHMLARDPNRAQELERLCTHSSDSIRALANVANKAGGTPLHYAATYGSARSATLLLEHGTSLGAITTNSKSTPLHKAAGRQDPEAAAVMKVLLEHAYNSETQKIDDLLAQKDANGKSALDIAKQNNPAVAEVLEAYSFRKAVIEGKPEKVDAILKQDPKIIQKHEKVYGTNNGILLAVADRPWDSAKRFNQDPASLMANLNANGAQKDATPRQSAVYCNIAQLLLHYEPNLAKTETQGICGKTPLHAAVKCNIPMVEQLRKHGADVNGKNRNGDTPLHTAIFNDKVKAVEALTKEIPGVAKANPTIPNKEGKSPLEQARSGRGAPSREIEALLQERYPHIQNSPSTQPQRGGGKGV